LNHSPLAWGILNRPHPVHFVPTGVSPKKSTAAAFLGIAGTSIAAAGFGVADFANAQSRKTKSAELHLIKPGTNTSFASLKQIDAARAA
jgi:tetrahydromethanopterin S-methyltransferase subunit D